MIKDKLYSTYLNAICDKVAERTVELSGIPPLSFTAKGKPLTAWSITGNTVQNGTPTPENPVEVLGCGDRTGNLFDNSLLEQGGLNASVGTIPTKLLPGETNYTNRTRYNQIIPLLASTLSLYCPANIKINYVWIDANGISLGESGFQKNGDTATAPEQAVSMTFILGLDSDIECTPSDFSDINLVAGSIAPESYEPYGYKIPVATSADGTEPITTPIYLGEVHTTRKIKKLVLTGNEPFIKNDGQSTHYLYYANKGTIFPRSIGRTPVICNELPEKNNAPQTVIGINTNNAFEVVYFNFGAEVMNAQPSGNTVAGLKEYLAQQYANGTPVTVWYVLVEPETGIVNEPLMKIGDYADTLSMEQAGVQIPTLNGTTVIDVDTAVKPENMTIKYKVV